jgi:hypothetical protein
MIGNGMKGTRMHKWGYIWSGWYRRAAGEFDKNKKIEYAVRNLEMKMERPRMLDHWEKHHEQWYNKRWHGEVLDVLKEGGVPALDGLVKQYPEASRHIESVLLRELAGGRGDPDVDWRLGARWDQEKVAEYLDRSDELPPWLHKIVFTLLQKVGATPSWLSQHVDMLLNRGGGPPKWLVDMVCEEMWSNALEYGQPPHWAREWVAEELYKNPKHPRFMPIVEATMTNAHGDWLRHGWLHDYPHVMAKM